LVSLQKLRRRTGKEKVYFSFQLLRKSDFPLSISEPSKSPLSTFQTMHFTSLERFRRRFCYSK
jgi:hypothetical protein